MHSHIYGVLVYLNVISITEVILLRMKWENTDKCYVNKDVNLMRILFSGSTLAFPRKARNITSLGYSNQCYDKNLKWVPK
jgi:hypothetical protein